MTGQDPTAPPPWQAAPEARDAGTMLREAREAAGLSLDMVSQQLKLAPRQVKALEDSEFELLPGRTFVRGFARNYARLLQLDPEAIVNALPGATGGGLEAPPLNPTAVTMGELPSAATGRAGWLRWVVGVAVLAAAIAAATYLLQGKLQRGTVEAPQPAPSVTASPPPVTSTAPTSGAGTPLPNPAISAPLDAGETSGAVPPAVAPAAPAAAPTAGDTAASGTAAAADAAAIAPIGLVVRAASWVEIKDASGRALISQTVQPGQSPTIVGSPPFDVVIGNAPDVSLSYRGQGVDLAPYTRGSVARLILK